MHDLPPLIALHHSVACSYDSGRPATFSVFLPGALLVLTPGGDGIASILQLSWVDRTHLLIMAAMGPLGFWLFSVAMRSNARVASVVQNFEVIFGVVFSWLLLGEVLQPRQWLGSVLVLLSVG
jgi:drug/metabolite transporter (DMT)-like permease